jgi:carboxylate-amine ligase
VLEHLVALRGELAARAAQHGATILAAGTHPTAHGAGQPVVPEPRSLAIAKQLGDALERQLVCGLHVHVGVDDWILGARAFRGLVEWLPTILALSANSPYDEGRDSGLRSVRAERLAELPTGGAPPTDLPPDGRDFSRVHWDMRPNYRYGTIEVRIADQQTDVGRSAAFAGLVQAVVRGEAARDGAPYDAELYAERRRAAAAGQLDPAEVDRLLDPVSGFAWAGALDRRPEADRQLALGLPAAVRDLSERSLQWPP